MLLRSVYNALLCLLLEFLLSTCRFIWMNVVCNYVLLENCLLCTWMSEKKSCRSTYTPTTEGQAWLPRVEFQFLNLHFVRGIIISLSGFGLLLTSGKNTRDIDIKTHQYQNANTFTSLIIQVS